jgi:Domain of unknown function (DUF1707)
MPGGWESSWGVGSWRSTDRGDGAIRASDAERSEVAEILSKHYTEGRLDKSELDERVERAMNAKTRAELSALLTDLPRQPQPQAPVPVPVQQPLPLLPLLLFPLFVVALLSAAVPPHIPVLLLLLPFFLLWRRRRGWRSSWQRRSGSGADQSYETWPGRGSGSSRY